MSEDARPNYDPNCSKFWSNGHWEEEYQQGSVGVRNSFDLVKTKIETQDKSLETAITLANLLHPFGFPSSQITI